MKTTQEEIFEDIRDRAIKASKVNPYGMISILELDSILREILIERKQLVEQIMAH